MSEQQQTGFGNELFGTPMGAAGRDDGNDGAVAEAGERDLDRIQVESEGQRLGV